MEKMKKIEATTIKRDDQPHQHVDYLIKTTVDSRSNDGKYLKVTTKHYTSTLGYHGEVTTDNKRYQSVTIPGENINKNRLPTTVDGNDNSENDLALLQLHFVC